MAQFRIHRVIIKKLDGNGKQQTVLSRVCNELTTGIEAYRSQLMREYGTEDVFLNYSQISGEPITSNYKKYLVTGAKLKRQSETLIEVFLIRVNVKTNDIGGLKSYLLKKHKATSVEFLEYRIV